MNSWIFPQFPVFWPFFFLLWPHTFSILKKMQKTDFFEKNKKFYFFQIQKFFARQKIPLNSKMFCDHFFDLRPQKNRKKHVFSAQNPGTPIPGFWPFFRLFLRSKNGLQSTGFFSKLKKSASKKNQVFEKKRVFFKIAKIAPKSGPRFFGPKKRSCGKIQFFANFWQKNSQKITSDSLQRFWRKKCHSVQLLTKNGPFLKIFW